MCLLHYMKVCCKCYNLAEINLAKYTLIGFRKHGMEKKFHSVVWMYYQMFMMVVPLTVGHLCGSVLRLFVLRWVQAF